MTDIEKTREEVEKLKSQLLRGACSSQIAMETRCKEEAYNEVLAILDTMQEEHVSEDKMTISKEWFEHCKKSWYNEGYIDGDYNRDRQFEETVSEDLGDYINKLSKQFPEVSFAKLSRIAVRVAKWHNEHLWKHADGNNLPIIDREVIALLDNGKVGFAHRPPEYWDGKNIVTGKVTRNYPKTYDKGGWNIPNVKYWLDCSLPNMED